MCVCKGPLGAGSFVCTGFQAAGQDQTGGSDCWTGSDWAETWYAAKKERKKGMYYHRSAPVAEAEVAEPVAEAPSRVMSNCVRHA